MKLQNLKDRNWNYPALSFAITFVSFLVLMIVKGMSPFGDSSMLYSDAYHQYYPFFLSFRQALRAGDSLLYNWDVGMGMDYLGLIAYYLASPLNLVSVLVPDSWTLAYFSLMVPIKLGLASWFFAWFLQKLTGAREFSVALFGSFYGLCAWSLAYLWNIMWLDTFALLPLVMVGMVSLLTQRKFMLYTLTLFLSVFANYYIGLFTCIFVLLSFFCYEICRWESFRKFFVDLGLMALFSLLAIGMTAILELPALAALQNTQSSVNTFPEGFRLNIASEHNFKGLLDAMRQVAGNMNGGLEPSFKEGLPNLYCGLFANAFGFLFLMSPKVKLRDKICCVLLILFFNVSVIIRQLDYIWHGFHFTNMIPYRFTFLHSFVLLYMAYRAYLLKDSYKLWQMILAGVLAIGLVVASESRADTMFLAYNGAFLLLYITVLVYNALEKKLPEDATEEEKEDALDLIRERKRYSALFLTVTIALELVLNLINFGVHFTGTNVSMYPRGTEYSASMIRYMHEREWDERFFRAETTHSQTLNDGALNGYHGISTFTSSANVAVTRFMARLGYGAKDTYNRYCYEESSPVNNLFLGLKYMLERSDQVEENPYFNDLHEYGGVHLLENNAYLPLGFLADSQLEQVNFDVTQDNFNFQNQLFTAATGIETPVWEHLEGESLTVTAEGGELTELTADGSCTYLMEDVSDGRVNFEYIAPTAGFLCISLDLSERNDFTLWRNGKELYSESYSIPQMLAVSQVQPGDVIDVALACDANSGGTIEISAALMNDSIFWDGYNKLSQSQLELTTFSTTYLEGQILCNRDGILYTSIPQDGNWYAFVDGQPVEPKRIGNVMMGIPLEKGYHTVSFRYHNNAFALGWKVSLACAAVLGALYFMIYPAKNRKGKYSK